jgi:hypothetical protein
MNQAALEKVIQDDLFNELRWLLCAATQWQACDQGASDTSAVPHLKVYSMDSTFLHARALYEFFTATKTSNSDRLTWKDFGLSQRINSTKYSLLISDLHGRALHLNKNRSSYAAIKDEVVNIATDILSLWDQFVSEARMRSFKAELNDRRQLAINDANAVAARYKISPIFS